MGFIVVVLGVTMMLVSLFGSMMGVHLPSGTSLVLGLAGALTTLGGTVITLLSFYRRTSADQAFVRTGLGGSHVVLDGGTTVLPFFHRALEINLKTMKLGVNPHGPNALITRDNLRANVLAQFYIRVQADREHILSAARSLGESSVNAEAVEELVSEKLVSALRAISSQMDLFEIHTKRDDFAERVKEHVKSDLEANGLLLESVTISELDQTDPAELSDNNVFDAQGKKKITEITAAAAVERNNLEREAERARKMRDVETRQQILELERKQATSEAQQATEIAKVRAEKDRESQEVQIQQLRQIEIAKIDKEQQIQAQEISRLQAIEVARTQQQQAVQTAQITRDQQLQMATVEREKSVSLAERQKQIAIAEAEASRAKAEAAALRAGAEREQASQQVLSVTQLAESEREANKKLIAARQQIEQDKLRQQTTADVEAYSRVKQAEADQEAAMKQAEARLQLAQADAQSRELVARGEKAQQMVAVEVARELVNVEGAKVAVERQQLENRQQFAEAGIKLEVQKLSIQANRDVQMEFARALAGFLSSGHMTLYGTPETASTMLDNMARGFGLRSLVEGFVHGNAAGGPRPAGAPDVVGDLIGQLGGLIGPALAKVMGGGQAPLSATATEDVARNLANNPMFISVLRDALTHRPSATSPVLPSAKPLVDPLKKG